MMKSKHALPALVVSALTVLTAGCYTVVETAAGKKTAPIAQDRNIGRMSTQAAGGSADAVMIEGEEYAEEEGQGEYCAGDGLDSAARGLNREKYLREYGGDEGRDGHTIVYNYYFDNEPAWYDAWYVRYGYDPRSVESFRPDWPQSFVYFGDLYNPFCCDDWHWNTGWSWGWYDSRHWKEPWRWHPGPWGYTYNPWDQGNKDFGDSGRWDSGGGGGGEKGDGNDIAAVSRKTRPDRLEGFGTGRGAGMGTEGGSIAGMSKPGETGSERSIHRYNREGFGTVSGIRGSPARIPSENAVKPSGPTPGAVNPSGLRRDIENVEAATRQRVRSAETTRMAQGEHDVPLLEIISRRARFQNDEQVGGATPEKNRIEHQAAGGRNGEANVMKTPIETRGERRPQTGIWIRRDFPVVSPLENSGRHAMRAGSNENPRLEGAQQSPETLQRSDSWRGVSDSSIRPLVQRQSTNNISGGSVSQSAPAPAGENSSSNPSVSSAAPSQGGSAGEQKTRPSASMSGSRRR